MSSSLALNLINTAFVPRANSGHGSDDKTKHGHLRSNYGPMAICFFLSFLRSTRFKRWWLTMRRTPTLFSCTRRTACSSLEHVLRRCSTWRSSCPRGSASPGEKSRILSYRALKGLTSASPATSSLSRTCTSKQLKFKSFNGCHINKRNDLWHK